MLTRVYTVHSNWVPVYQHEVEDKCSESLNAMQILLRQRGTGNWVPKMAKSVFKSVRDSRITRNILESP
jgi:hypothetical protein